MKNIKPIMELYKKGKISLSKAAEVSGKNMHEIIYLAEKYGIKAGATVKQLELSEKNAEKLKLKK